MHITIYVKQLATNRDVFKSIFKDLPPSLWRWQSQPDKWCLLEVLCHLFDEERWDFKDRIRHIFNQSGDPFVPFDPLKWMVENKYLQQDPEEALIRFLEERRASVQWLKGLEEVDWSKTSITRNNVKMSAKQLISNWLAHDYLHIRQINRIKYEYLHSYSEEDLNYAGTW